MIDLNQSTENQKRNSKRILIAEPEPDIQYLYSLFTKQYGFSISDVNMVESGNKCLEIVLSGINDNNHDYDIIIIELTFMTFQALKLQKRFVINYHIKE